MYLIIGSGSVKVEIGIRRIKTNSIPNETLIFLSTNLIIYMIFCSVPVAIENDKKKCEYHLLFVVWKYNSNLIIITIKDSTTLEIIV